MENRADDESLLNDPKRLLLDMAQEYSGAELLQMIVTRLSGLPRIALARIWLVLGPIAEMESISISRTAAM